MNDFEGKTPEVTGAASRIGLALAERFAAEALIAQGKDPAEIADAVFEAIAQDNLYVLPHPAWDDFVRARIDHDLARRGPATMDPAELMRRRAGGEDL
jgi:NAD(P)-dependent dehydrogenase (short-subunit alcohol dehydrogenase family)